MGQVRDIAGLKSFIAGLPLTTLSKRKNTIEDLQSLLAVDCENSYETVAGALTFEKEKIDVSYKSIPLPGFVYSSKRSNLYKELSDELKLSVEDELACLWHYYQYRVAEKKDVAKLAKEFQPITDNLLRKLPNLKILLTERPTLDTITKRLQEQFSPYEAECKERWFSPTIKHVKYRHLLNLLVSPLMDEVLASLSKTETGQKQLRYSIYYGMLLFIASDIIKDCIGTTYKPENSTLFQFCMKTLNIESPCDIPELIRINFLVDAGLFIDQIKANSAIVNHLKAIKLKDGLIYGVVLFDDALEFLNASAINIRGHLEHESLTMTCIKSAGNYVAQALLVMAALEIGAGIYTAGVGKAALPFIVNKIGQFLLQESIGTTFTIKIAKNYAAQIEPALMTNVYANIVYLGGRRLKSSLFPPIDPVYAACDVARKFRTELKKEVVGSPKSLQQQPKLIRMLVELPSTYISEAVKNRVKEIIIKPTEKPKVVAEAKGFRI